MSESSPLLMSAIRGYSLAFGLVLLAACGSLLPEDKAFYAKVDGIALGAAEADVLKKLGPPGYSGSTFFLSQPAGYEKQYEAAAQSGSVRFHSWHRDIDVTCTVGIDGSSRVAYKACGGT